MNHDLYKDGDTGIPEQITDRNGQVELALCKRCGKAEIELSGPCVTEREKALREAAAIAYSAVYSGDYPSSDTDARDDVARWIERRILMLADEESAKA
jgi:hypothetical protein